MWQGCWFPVPLHPLSSKEDMATGRVQAQVDAEHTEVVSAAEAGPSLCGVMLDNHRLSSKPVQLLPHRETRFDMNPIRKQVFSWGGKGNCIIGKTFFTCKVCYTLLRWPCPCLGPPKWGLCLPFCHWVPHGACLTEVSRVSPQLSCSKLLPQSPVVPWVLG